MTVSSDDRSTRPTIVIVDDDHPMRRSVQLLLQAQGYRVKAFSSGTALLAGSKALDAAFLITADLAQPIDGIVLLRTLRSGGWAGPAVLVTAFWTPQLVEEARAAGFCEVLRKPVRHRALIKLVAQNIADPPPD